MSNNNTNKNENPENNEINGDYVSGNELLVASAVLLSEVTEDDTIETTNIINGIKNDVSDNDSDVSSSDSNGTNSISQMVYKTNPAQRKQKTTQSDNHFLFFCFCFFFLSCI